MSYLVYKLRLVYKSPNANVRDGHLKARTPPQHTIWYKFIFFSLGKNIMYGFIFLMFNTYVHCFFTYIKFTIYYHYCCYCCSLFVLVLFDVVSFAINSQIVYIRISIELYVSINTQIHKKRDKHTQPHTKINKIEIHGHTHTQCIYTHAKACIL